MIGHLNSNLPYGELHVNIDEYTLVHIFQINSKTVKDNFNMTEIWNPR